MQEGKIMVELVSVKNCFCGYLGLGTIMTRDKQVCAVYRPWRCLCIKYIFTVVPCGLLAWS
jgi:hypothetical protein